MSRRNESTSSFLSLEDRARIDAIADKFESQWKQNQDTKIEEFLGELPTQLRRPLLSELLRTELELKVSRGQSIEIEAYLSRFSEAQDVVREAMRSGGHVDSRAAPMQIGGYAFVRDLGEGGFGRVCLYRDEILNREVAIKLPRSDQFRYDRERLLSEIRALAKFDHPAIVKIYAAGELDDGRLYIVMEYVGGTVLDEFLQSNQLSASETIEIVSTIADALHKAHVEGFVHRDVKPGNILLDAHGAPHLSDFGLAIHETEQHRFSGDGAGTLAYRAPEQVHGQADWMDARCDIWALGVVLYEMLAGRKPFNAKSIAELNDQIIHREPRSLRTINDQIPVALQEACLKCLRKDPAKRFTAADELATTLRSIELSAIHSPSLLEGSRSTQALDTPVAESEVQKIFISYAHSNPDEKQLAHEIYDRLTALGKECFIDTKITAGTEWVTEIESRLNWCHFFVVLISRNSMKSEMVQTEVRLAHQLKRKNPRPTILPIRMGAYGELEYELNLYLGALHYLHWNATYDSPRIVNSIAEAVEGNYEQVSWKTESIDRTGEGTVSRNSSRPSPASNMTALTVPGGTIKPNDPNYVRREADERVAESADGTNTIVFKGPRQHGKSSMLMYYLHECQKRGKKVAYVDMSIFSNEQMQEYVHFLVHLGQLIAIRLGADASGAREIDSQYAMTQFLENVLNSIDQRVVIALDEADRLFGHGYQNDFFSMLRMWHNNRSSFLSPAWENVDLAMAISTEPYLLISESDRSPFNVGLTLELRPFTLTELRDLNNRLGKLLLSDEEEQLHQLLGGHPYLTRLAFYRLSGKIAMSFQELCETAHHEHGPFGEHLRAILFKIHNSPDLLTALKQVVSQGKLDSQDLYFRLYGAGLVVEQNQRIDPSNLVYARFFRTVL